MSSPPKMCTSERVVDGGDKNVGRSERFSGNVLEINNYFYNIYKTTINVDSGNFLETSRSFPETGQPP